MVRTQVQFTDQQRDALRRLARRDGISISEVVRRCVAGRLAPEKGQTRRERTREALELFGKYRDRESRRDVARRHDVYLDQAFDS